MVLDVRTQGTQAGLLRRNRIRNFFDLVESRSGQMRQAKFGRCGSRAGPLFFARRQTPKPLLYSGPSMRMPLVRLPGLVLELAPCSTVTFSLAGASFNSCDGVQGVRAETLRSAGDEERQRRLAPLCAVCPLPPLTSSNPGVCGHSRGRRSRWLERDAHLWNVQAVVVNSCLVVPATPEIHLKALRLM